MARLFGTDGVRGIANKELTIDLAYKLGQAGAYILTKENKHKPTILVGRDTRISGEMLSSALMAGICSVGADAVLIDIVPTPAVAYLTRKYNADAGVVISASHNPVEYNGIKFFNNKGLKLSDELEDDIEKLIANNNQDIELPVGTDIGRIKNKEDALNDYVDYIVNLIDVDLSGLKIALDCANGASYLSSPDAIRKLGAEVHVIHNTPDGTNINKNCGSTHMNELKEFVLEIGADIGIAFDGDADRCLAIDNKGNLIDGDKIMAICGDYMKKEGTLKNDTIVATVMSNLGFFIMGKEKNINIEQTQVGDRYVLENMLKNNYNLGGEQSGHIIFLDVNTTGDGLSTAVHLLEVLKKSNKTASELAGIMDVLPQVLVNAKVKNEHKHVYMEDTDIKEAIEKLEAKFAGEGRVLIRPSGTEPLVRVMIEGKDQNVLENEAKKLAELIEKKLG